jgi:uncharacterized damage-inducible protein DinB
MASLEAHFRAMARNNLWSNHRLHAACARLPAEEYRRDRRAFFRSIHGTLNHILLIDRYYLTALEGGLADASPHDRELYRDLGPLSAAQRESDRRLIEVCDGLGAEGLDRVASWTDVSGDRCSDPVHVVLSHLFLHQIHHRGQVHDMLSAAGAKPPQLDEFFPSHDRPLREAELRELGLES